MTAQHAAAQFAGHWTHSYEEDSDGVQVYRPTQGFAFPPSRRGRATLVVGPDGQAQTGRPGPDDRQQMSGVSLTALGMQRFRLDGAGLPGQVIEVVDAGPDVLKLRYL